MLQTDALPTGIPHTQWIIEIKPTLGILFDVSEVKVNNSSPDQTPVSVFPISSESITHLAQRHRLLSTNPTTIRQLPVFNPCAHGSRKIRPNFRKPLSLTTLSLFIVLKFCGVPSGRMRGVMRASSGDSSVLRSTAEVRRALLISSNTLPPSERHRGGVGGVREGKKKNQKQSQLSRRDARRRGREGGEKAAWAASSPGWMKSQKALSAYTACVIVYTLNARFVEWVSGSTGRESLHTVHPHGYQLT